MVDEHSQALRQSILRLAALRGHDKTICPSEVARDVAGSDPVQWRPLMPAIKKVAVRLATAGAVDIRQGGRPIGPLKFTGVYRIGLR